MNNCLECKFFLSERFSWPECWEYYWFNTNCLDDDGQVVQWNTIGQPRWLANVSGQLPWNREPPDWKLKYRSTTSKTMYQVYLQIVWSKWFVSLNSFLFKTFRDCHSDTVTINQAQNCSEKHSFMWKSVFNGPIGLTKINIFRDAMQMVYGYWAKDLVELDSSLASGEKCIWYRRKEQLLLKAAMFRYQL